MNDYVRLPSQQFNNLVKRYIQHRKATALEGKSMPNRAAAIRTASMSIDRIQSETFDNEAKSVMEKMSSYHERVRRRFFTAFLQRRNHLSCSSSDPDRSANVSPAFVSIEQR